MDPIWHLFNSHSWYVLDTAWDHARAWLWISFNLITAACYLYFIVREILRWRTAVGFPVTNVVGLHFTAFIFLCGLSHIAMVVVMPTAPWWTMLIFGPMAVESAICAYILRRLRAHIVGALVANVDMLRGAEAWRLGGRGSDGQQ